MPILVVQLHGSISWKITDSFPEITKISTEPYFALINPITMYYTLSVHSRPVETYFGHIWTKDDEFVISCNAIGLLFDVADFNDSTDVFMKLNQFLHIFLNALRCASGQASIPLSYEEFTPFIDMTYIMDTDVLSSTSFPLKKLDQTGTVDSFFWESAITEEDVRTAAKLYTHGSCSPHNDILIDAIAAARNADHRKCLIYSAISMESMANFVLNKKYKTMLDTEVNDTSLRVVNVTISKNETTKKDPIFDFLWRSREFKYRLHEIPLYLLGRSLHLENDGLYQRALNIYQTRNDIVHEGVTNKKDLSFFSSREILKDTLDVFRWFGEGKRFALPFQGSVVFNIAQLTEAHD